MYEKSKITEYLQKTKGFDPEQIIKFASQEFGKELTFASSLGEEDQVLTDMIAHINPEVEIFTLDTGRLFQETYELLAKTQKKYPMTFKIYYPDTQAVEDMVESHGINLFYESVQNRKTCCGIRKVEPLKRALNNFDAWLSGLRRAQSISRVTVETFEWDEANKKVKINPLAHWSRDQVQDYIKKNNIDINTLHAQGFVSIGCASCTRAVQPGEDARAGRWWWEENDSKECGLHVNPKKVSNE